MATQTSLVAQQVRIRQWAEQIRNCQNRPKGMDVETWCTQNNLTKANYYYRLRRVRQICLDQMQDTETTAFVELPAPAPDPKKTDTPKESGTCISAGTLPMIRIKNTRCIFRKNCASVPEERSAIPLQTEQSSAG